MFVSLQKLQCQVAIGVQIPDPRLRGSRVSALLTGAWIAWGWLKTTPVTRVSVCVVRCDKIGPTARLVKRPIYTDLNEEDISFRGPSGLVHVSRSAKIKQKERSEVCFSQESVSVMGVSSLILVSSRCLVRTGRLV